MITSKMEEVSSGMSRVVETDHVLILGWNVSTLRLVSQIGLAKGERSDAGSVRQRAPVTETGTRAS